MSDMPGMVSTVTMSMTVAVMTHAVITLLVLILKRVALTAPVIIIIFVTLSNMTQYRREVQRRSYLKGLQRLNLIQL